MELEVNCNELSKIVNAFGIQEVAPYSDGKGLLINLQNSGNTLELRSIDLSGKYLQKGIDWQWYISLPQNSDLIKMEVKS